MGSHDIRLLQKEQDDGRWTANRNGKTCAVWCNLSTRASYDAVVLCPVTAGRRCWVMTSVCEYLRHWMCLNLEANVWSLDASLRPRRNRCEIEDVEDPGTFHFVFESAFRQNILNIERRTNSSSEIVSNVYICKLLLLVLFRHLCWKKCGCMR